MVNINYETMISFENFFGTTKEWGVEIIKNDSKLLTRTVGFARLAEVIFNYKKVLFSPEVNIFGNVICIIESECALRAVYTGHRNLRECYFSS